MASVCSEYDHIGKNLVAFATDLVTMYSPGPTKVLVDQPQLQFGALMYINVKAMRLHLMQHDCEYAFQELIISNNSSLTKLRFVCHPSLLTPLLCTVFKSRGLLEEKLLEYFMQETF